MCGIGGLIYEDKNHIVNQTLLQKMTDSIIHRGPDEKGIYQFKNVGLGFRRLSIIDLKNGHQPMSSYNDKFHIVFNGEIYNFKEKRKLLQSRGYNFTTKSDTEVLLNLYIEFGNDCLKHLRGMFSFAIFDKVRNILFCARDRIGIKPFYYFFDERKFIFGSEIKVILKSGLITPTISSKALDSFLAYGYTAKDLSIYNEIKKLKPSQYFELDLNSWQLKENNYWNLNYKINYKYTEQDWIKKLEFKFNEVIKLHKVSDVPIGSFLSGGIDSSGVTAFLANNSNKPINTFSIGFHEEKYNELNYAREVSKRYGTNHYEEIVEPKSIELIPEIVNGFDEPFADSSAIPTYLVSKFASKHVKVIMSGDGGDELFAGYKLYKKMMLVNKYNFSSPKFNKLLWGNINRLTPNFSKLNRITYFLSQNKKMIGAYNGIFTQVDRRKILSDHLQNKINDDQIEFDSQNIINKYSKYDFLTTMQNLNIERYMVDDILTKVDRMSMLNSLEVRVPILDHEFIELVCTIPTELKMKGKNQKYIFKNMLESYVPNSILEHKKQGFAVPLNSWFKDDLKGYLIELFLNNNSKLYDYVEKKFVKQLLNKHRKGTYDLSSHIWSLIIFENWLQINNIHYSK